MLKRFFNRRGFTLVEALIALALLGMIMLFVTRTIALLSDASEDTDGMLLGSSTNLVVVSELQDVFMQGKAIRTDGERFIVVTAEKEISISIANNNLLIDNKITAPLLHGTLQKVGNGVSVNLALTNKSFIQTTFYINEGGSYEKTSLE